MRKKKNNNINTYTNHRSELKIISGVSPVPDKPKNILIQRRPSAWVSLD